jgi:D-amino-acid oxidase
VDQSLWKSCSRAESLPCHFPIALVSLTDTVVGAGCVGLTTAVRLLEAGYPVLVVAEHLPSHPLNARYASTSAGAHHLSFADNQDWRQRFLDQRTFDVFWKESEDAEIANQRGILRLTQTEYYTGDEKHIRFLEQLPDVSSYDMPLEDACERGSRVNLQFKVLDGDSRPSFADHSCSFTSFTIEPARYMPYLLKRIAQLGGKVQCIPRLHSLEAAVQHAQTPTAIINCTGLGARDLQDVRDTTVIPVRGQVLALYAPWVRSGWTRQVGSLNGGEGGQRTYIIPRASGEVIVGGTREAEDW